MVDLTYFLGTLKNVATGAGGGNGGGRKFGGNSRLASILEGDDEPADLKSAFGSRVHCHLKTKETTPDEPPNIPTFFEGIMREPRSKPLRFDDLTRRSNNLIVPCGCGRISLRGSLFLLRPETAKTTRLLRLSTNNTGSFGLGNRVSHAAC